VGPTPTFTLIVIAFFIIIQQLENNLLVLHIGPCPEANPVVILIAAVIGATLAGILESCCRRRRLRH
jgi:predicted PurR-regulated permease PerM